MEPYLSASVDLMFEELAREKPDMLPIRQTGK